ncbi:error-prone DNA polymerase [Methanobrevibacter curvatus]|uniref:DNA polymerase II small subunit n=2 Tax=Methanobrevibacter curvatus TaxID=49547 RepID=A0A166D7B5_9EURY|nr:error-prone DNA polymerase [Methanobrevibacter curvatus]
MLKNLDKMNELLIKLAENGINIGPESFKKIKTLKNPLEFVSTLIIKIKSQFKSKELVVIKDEIINSYLEEFKNSASENTAETIAKKEINKTEEINKNKETDENKEINKNKDENKELNEEINKPNRNQDGVEGKFNFEILIDTSKKSYTKGELVDFVSLFKSRFEKLSKILKKRSQLKVVKKISEIHAQDKQNDFSTIGMIKEIKKTKNGHIFMELEDETGVLNVLISKDDAELIKFSEKLVKDEVVGVLGKIGKNSKKDPKNGSKKESNKSNSLSIASEIIQPGVTRIDKKKMDFSVCFCSDIHIGSNTFVEESFVKFIDWINGDFENEEFKAIGMDIKYLIISGDIVDGIGIYPNQDKELKIKDITKQYDKAAELLSKIRTGVKIIIGPGNHDASRVAEPQPAVPKEYAKSLYELKNVEFVSNPALISLEGIKVLMYHGRGIDDMALGVKGMSMEENDKIMKELMNKRHLAPLYGERTPLAAELEDHLVIDDLPDIFHTGHVHINSYKNYNGIHMINSGTFQTQTEFQKTHNINPTVAVVPILHRGKFIEINFLSSQKKNRK